MFIHLDASGVERHVAMLLLQHGHHAVRVHGPPVHQEVGMCAGLRWTPADRLGFQVKRVTPWFGLPEEMDHLGIGTKSEKRQIELVN